MLVFVRGGNVLPTIPAQHHMGEVLDIKSGKESKLYTQKCFKVGVSAYVIQIRIFFDPAPIKLTLRIIKNLF